MSLMNIRIANKREIKKYSKVPAMAFGKKKEILFIFVDKEWQEALVFDTFDDFLKDILHHEIMHIILHNIISPKVASKYDNISLDIDNFGYDRI